ncbi:SIR2 family NAD-dependent protein deacylase [Fundidesulfovibrio putealis]|uniref:SIR2 family NAD-dependent protein deacylase n=1 Tax=Fundidesulfovibrio putealis TaxID=270496 RepID=UPI000419ECBB|nr:NAD-dependent deacylase [Fundidesulfovibrio putealis]
MMDELKKIARLWPTSGKVLVLTGAGISVASGIPDFRSPGGLWSVYDPMQVATADALDNNPMAVWKFLMDAVWVMSRAEPNPAHLALAELERAGMLEAVVTQNIDGLHQRAGSQNVLEFHGSMSRYRCNSCEKPHDAALARSITLATAPWRCDCGGVVRPDIVFFGEAIPLDALHKSGQLACGAELTLIVGTSCEVTPASSLPGLTKQYGGRLAEINLEPGRMAHLCDARVAAKAEEALPELARLLLEHRNTTTR